MGIYTFKQPFGSFKDNKYWLCVQENEFVTCLILLTHVDRNVY